MRDKPRISWFDFILFICIYSRCPGLCDESQMLRASRSRICRTFALFSHPLRIRSYRCFSAAYASCNRKYRCYAPRAPASAENIRAPCYCIPHSYFLARPMAGLSGTQASLFVQPLSGAFLLHHSHSAGRSSCCRCLFLDISHNRFCGQ